MRCGLLRRWWSQPGVCNRHFWWKDMHFVNTPYSVFRFFRRRQLRKFASDSVRTIRWVQSLGGHTRLVQDMLGSVIESVFCLSWAIDVLTVAHCAFLPHNWRVSHVMFQIRFRPIQIVLQETWGNRWVNFWDGPGYTCFPLVVSGVLSNSSWTWNWCVDNKLKTVFTAFSYIMFLRIGITRRPSIEWIHCFLYILQQFQQMTYEKISLSAD